MTAQQEIRFRCDRCGLDETTVLANAPLQQRMAPPGGWLMLAVDGGELQRHLCPGCAGLFRELMEPA